VSTLAKVGWDAQQFRQVYENAKRNHQRFERVVEDTLRELKRIEDATTGGLGSFIDNLAPGPSKSLLKELPGPLGPVIKALEEYLKQLKSLDKELEKVEQLIPSDGNSNGMIPGTLVIE